MAPDGGANSPGVRKAVELGSGSADGGSADGGSADGGAADGGAADGGASDGGASDGGASDGGAVQSCGLSGSETARSSSPPAQVNCTAFVGVDDFDCDGGCSATYAMDVMADPGGNGVYVAGLGLVGGVPHTFIRYSPDGTNWTTIDTSPSASDTVAPRVTVDGCGNVFGTSQADAGVAPWMQLRRRAMGASSFSTVVLPGPLTGSGWPANVAVAPDGGLFLTGTSGDEQVTLSSTDHGLTWTQVASTPGSQGVSLEPASTFVSAAGTLFSSSRESPGPLTQVVRAAITGSALSPTFHPLGNGQSNAGAASSNGALFVGSDIGLSWKLFKSTDDGLSWTPEQTINLPASTHCYGAGVWAGTRGVFALRNCTTGNVSSASLFISPDGLATSTSGLNDYTYYTGAATYLHAVSVSPSGEVYVVGQVFNAVKGGLRWIVLRSTCSN